MSTGYYIYYKVPTEQVAAVQVLIPRIQEEVARITGIQGRFLCQAQADHDVQTFMEIYEPVPEAAADTLVAVLAALAETDLKSLLVPGTIRNIEIFKSIT